MQSLRALAGRTGWDWKRCPTCGSTLTIKNGSYKRQPWFLGRREVVRVQRHLCYTCAGTYSDQSALLVGGSRYAREVHRAAVDHWQHSGTSLRRTAEVLRSWLRRQERYLAWSPMAEAPPTAQQCHLAASSVHRWLDQAGLVAQASGPGQLQDIGQSGKVGGHGLWARLCGGAKRAECCWPTVSAVCCGHRPKEV